MPRLRKASWVMLVVIGALGLVFSVLSLINAYARSYRIGSVPLAAVAAGRPEVETALRGIRSTSAAYALAYAVLLIGIAAGPYKRGDKSSWWAILASASALFVAVAARQPLLGTTLGISAPATALGLVAVALFLDGGRLKGA
jgi:hypothetical protein